MIRSPIVLAALFLLAVGAAVYARARRAGDLVDRVEGVRISSHWRCDGSTNPQEELDFETAFSPGGVARAFHLDVFESRYCKLVDVHFFCVIHGHDHWKHEWAQASQGPQGQARYWINACTAWGAENPQEYILSGWYQEGVGDRKAPWKQAVIKQVSATPEIYEFTDAGGGTARLEIKRK